jgi:hypothetical protein
MKGVPFIAVFALSPFETFGLSAVEALAERTIALLSSGQLAQAGERTYRYATQHLSWTAAFDRMVDFYHDIVATVRRGG